MSRQEIEGRARKIITDHLSLRDEQVTDESTLIDWGADSLDEIELLIVFEEEFGVEIPNAQAEAITTFREATDLIDSLLNSAP